MFALHIIKWRMPIKENTMKYVCDVCGYIYDEDLGDFENNIAPNTKWEALGEDWVCPICMVDKEQFSVYTE